MIKIREAEGVKNSCRKKSPDFTFLAHKGLQLKKKKIQNKVSQHSSIISLAAPHWLHSCTRQRGKSHWGQKNRWKRGFGGSFRKLESSCLSMAGNLSATHRTDISEAEGVAFLQRDLEGRICCQPEALSLRSCSECSLNRPDKSRSFALSKKSTRGESGEQEQPPLGRLLCPCKCECF